MPEANEKGQSADVDVQFMIKIGEKQFKVGFNGSYEISELSNIVATFEEFMAQARNQIRSTSH